MSSVWPSVQYKGSPVIIFQHHIQHRAEHPEVTPKYSKYHNAPLLESDRFLKMALPSLAVWLYANIFTSLNLRFSICKVGTRTLTEIF